MSKENKQLVNAKTWTICVALTVGFWVFMTWIMLPFVPPAGSGWTLFWAVFSATPIAITFYFAAMCFSATFVDQVRGQPE